MAVLQNSIHGLSVLIQTEMGVGVPTSYHMPQRAEESEYEAQAIVIEHAHALMHSVWSIWRGDWNRDIRRHAPTLRILKRLGA